LSKSFLIGVDLGTSVVNSTLFNLDGEALADASRSMQIHQPKSGYAEQNPHDFVVAASDTIREIIEKSAVAPSSVAAADFDGQMAGAFAGLKGNWHLWIPPV
jgi:xylulokinase